MSRGRNAVLRADSYRVVGGEVPPSTEAQELAEQLMNATPLPFETVHLPLLLHAAGGAARQRVAAFGQGAPALANGRMDLHAFERQPCHLRGVDRGVYRPDRIDADPSLGLKLEDLGAGDV